MCFVSCFRKHICETNIGEQMVLDGFRRLCDNSAPATRRLSLGTCCVSEVSQSALVSSRTGRSLANWHWAPNIPVVRCRKMRPHRDMRSVVRRSASEEGINQFWFHENILGVTLKSTIRSSKRVIRVYCILVLYWRRTGSVVATICPRSSSYVTTGEL